MPTVSLDHYWVCYMGGSKRKVCKHPLHSKGIIVITLVVVIKIGHVLA